MTLARRLIAVMVSVALIAAAPDYACYSACANDVAWQAKSGVRVIPTVHPMDTPAMPGGVPSYTIQHNGELSPLSHSAMFGTMPQIFNVYGTVGDAPTHHDGQVNIHTGQANIQLTQTVGVLTHTSMNGQAGQLNALYWGHGINSDIGSWDATTNTTWNVSVAGNRGLVGAQRLSHNAAIQIGSTMPSIHPTQKTWTQNHPESLMVGLTLLALWVWKGARILRKVFPNWTGPQAAQSVDGKKIPAAIWMFFMGSFPYAFSTWMAASALPPEADQVGGSEFKLLTQGLLFACVFFGTPFGVKWAKEGRDREVFVAAAAASGLSLLIVALAHGAIASNPSFVKAVFLIARIANGLIGGMLMAVNDKALIALIAGRDKSLLDQGNGLYRVAYWFMGALAAYLVFSLLGSWGIVPLALIGAAAGLFGIPFIQAIELPKKPVDSTADSYWQVLTSVPRSLGRAMVGLLRVLSFRRVIPREVSLQISTLTVGQKSVFVFLTFLLLASFGLISPAIGATFSAVMMPILICSYAIGAILIATPLGFEPQLEPILSRYGLGWIFSKSSELLWLAATAASFAVFLFSSLQVHNEIFSWLSMGLLGFTGNGALIKWTTFILMQAPAAAKENFGSLFNWALGMIVTLFAALIVLPYWKYHGIPPSAELSAMKKELVARLLPLSFWPVAVFGIASWFFASLAKPSTPKKS